MNLILKFLLGLFFLLLLFGSIKEGWEHWWAGRRAGSLVCVAVGILSVLGMLWAMGMI